LTRCPTPALKKEVIDDEIPDGIKFIRRFSMSRKIITTNNPPKSPDPVIRPADRGPVAGESLAQGGRPFVTREATAEEWATFEKIVRERLAKTPREIPEICQNCGHISSRNYRMPAGRSCLCGGTYKDLSDQEIRIYQDQKAKTDAEWAKRTKAAAWNSDCEAKRRAGIEPLTRLAFDEKRRQEMETRKAREESIQDLARKLAQRLPR
jgi:hypothetical protein